MASSVAIDCANKGAHVAWIAPTYKNSRPLWRMAESLTMPVFDLVEIRRSERTIDFPSGGALSIYSADNPTSILGESFDLAILDEAARISEDAWAETIMPTLADRAGRAMLISTPKGRNWFWREWMRGINNEPGYASFTAPSSDNPNQNIKRAALMARERVPERTYKQEWLAEFIDDSGNVFRNIRECATAELQSKANGTSRYTVGIDWARSNDFTVITVIDQTKREVCHIDRFTGIGYQLQLGRLSAIVERFNPAHIVAESNSMGGPLVEAIQRKGWPVHAFNTTNASKGEIIDGLALALERMDIKIPNDPVLIGELIAYEMETTKSGLIRYGAPDGMHDDMVMSLALCFSAIASSSRGIYL